MVTKTTKYKTGDSFDIDQGLDIPEFDFGSFEAGFDKKLANEGPVTEVVGSFASGVGASFLNPNIIESTIRRALPPEYGAALDLGQKSLGSARSLYNQAVKEFKPAINQFKQATRQVLPQTEGILSKNIQEKLKDWSKDQTVAGVSEETMRTQALAIELGQIFQAQAQDADRRQESDDRKEQIREGVDQLRHNDNLGHLGAIAENTARIVSFNDNIATSAMRKSLEVQLRQLYTVSDLLRETKIANTQKRAQLEAVVRNTGISARSVAAKDEGSFKNKFLDATKRSMFGAASNFAEQYIGNVQKDVGEKITSGAQSADMLGGALNMLAGFGGMGQDGGGGSVKGTVANFLGSLLGDHLVGKAQDKAKDYLGRIPGVQRNAEKIGYNLENAGPQLTDYLSDSNNTLGPLEPFREYLVSMLPKTGVDGKLDVATLGKANDQAHFTNATNKSIIEVIPGLLARIQRELVITRTGKNAPLLAYDYSSNKFSTEKQIGAQVRDSMVGEANRKDVKERFDEMFAKIDPKNDLSDEHREKVKKEFLDRGFQGKSTDAKYLATKRTWGEGDDAATIAKFFQNYLKTNSVGKRDDQSLEAIKNQRELSQEIARITRFFNDPRADLQSMARLGQLDSIQASGLYDRRSNSIDFDNVARGLLGQGEGGSGGDGDSMHEFDLTEIVRPGKISPSSIMEDAGATAIPKRQRTIQRDSRLAAQERQNRLRESLRGKPKDPGAIPQSAAQPTGAAALAPVVEAKIDTAAIEKLLADQIEQVKKIDPNANLLTIIDILRATQKNVEQVEESVVKVEERLEEGINTYSLTEDMLGPEARKNFRERFGKFGKKLGDTAVSAVNKVKGLKDITIGDIFSKGADFASGLGSLGMKAIGSAASMGTRAVKMGTTLASGALNQVGKIAGKGVDVFGDLYVEGESEPRLTRAKMKTGKYFDKKSGKVLTSLKNIKGPIENEEGEEVLSADELEKSYVKGKTITALKEIVTTAADWGAQIGSIATKGLGTFYGTAVTVGVKLFKGAQKLLPPYDVYIKGQEKPVLTAGGFKTGEYFSEKTQKALTHPREIDGPVLNKTGDHLITEDDMRIGLVDKNGLTVTNKAARLIGKVTQLAKFGLGVGMKALRGIAGSAKEFLVGIGQAMKDIFGGVFGLRGEYLETSRSQLEVQRQILQILMDRLPKGKNVKGDLDGDGIREGSAADIRKKEAAEAEKANTQPGAISAQTGGGKGLLASIAGMLDGKKKKDEDEDDGSMLDDAADVADIYDAANGDGQSRDDGRGKGKGRRGRRAPKPSKLKSFGGKALKYGGKALGVAGAAYGALSAVDAVSKGNYGEAALDAGLAVGSTALTVGGIGGLGATAGAIGSGALATAGAIGTGVAATVGAILSAPVLLTALGIAAVGTAGYYGYKYLTRKKLETLSKVRFAQYGFSEQDKERLEVVFGLEDMLAKNVRVDGDKAFLDSNKVDMEALMKPFGVRMNSEFSSQWLSWFSGRFKPVYLAHMAVLKGINPEVRLDDVDSKLKPDEKLKYLNASAMPSGPFDQLEAPFQDIKQLSVSSTGVKAIVELAREELTKAAKEDKTATAAKGVGAAATGAALLKTAKDDKGVQTGNSTPNGQADVATKAALAAAGADAVTNKEGSISISAFNTVPGDFIFTGQKGTIDALSSVRYKAYGLTEMELPKIKHLSALEAQVAKGLVFTKSGAAYDEDIRDLLSRVKILFGIVGPESEEGRNWIIWFRSRFLPVFLNYQTLVQKATGKSEYVSAEMKLTPQQQLDVANALVTTTGVYKGKTIPVWDITQSPWRDYMVNTDSSSTDLNIQYLTENVKAVKAGEQKTSAKQAEAKTNEQAAINAGTAADTKWRLNTPVGQIAVPKDPISLRKDREEMARKTGYIQPGPLSADGKGVRAAGDFVKGAAIAHPGKGTGGDVNSLPEPTGNNWTGMKAMFDAAAKMTGVDVKTLAAMCAIESNFNPDAKAGTSSASGLFQFLTGTWNGMMNKYAAKYGIDPRTSPTDPRAAVLMGAEFIKENLNTLKNRVKGRELTNTDAYMAHFLGAGTAAKFLNSDPNAIGADVMRGPPGKDPVAANMNVFFDKKTGQPRTLGEIYKLFNMKMDRESKKAGVGDSAPATPNPTPKTGPVAGDSAGGGNVATPTTGAATPKPAEKSAPATAALAQANATAAPVSAVATKTTPPVPQPQPQAEAPVATGGAYTAPSMPAAVAAKSPVRVTPDFNGWEPRSRPSGAEISAQGDAVRKAMLASMTDIGKVLTDSRDLHRESLQVLQVIAKNTSATTTAAAPEKKSNAPVANAPSSPIPQRAQQAPVSMSRQY